MKESSVLAHGLLVSLNGDPEDSQEVIAQAWDEEIARRVADMDAGRTNWIPADELMTKSPHENSCCQDSCGSA